MPNHGMEATKLNICKITYKFLVGDKNLGQLSKRKYRKTSQFRGNFLWALNYVKMITNSYCQCKICNFVAI